MLSLSIFLDYVFFQIWKQSALLKPAFNHFYLQVTITGAAKGGGEAATTTATGTATPLRQTRTAARLLRTGPFPTGFSFSKPSPKPHRPQGSRAAGGGLSPGPAEGPIGPRPRVHAAPNHAARETGLPPQPAPVARAPIGPRPPGHPDLPPPAEALPPTWPSPGPRPPKRSALLATGPASPHRPQRSTAGRPAGPGKGPSQPPSPEGRRGSAGAILPSARRCRLRRTNAGPSAASARPLARGSRENRPLGQSAPGEGRENATIETALGPERTSARAGAALPRGGGTIETAPGGPPRQRGGSGPIPAGPPRSRSAGIAGGRKVRSGYVNV